MGTLNEQIMQSWCGPAACFGSPSHPHHPLSQCQTFLAWQPMVSGTSSRAGAIQVTPDCGWAENLVSISILWSPPTWGTCFHSWGIPMAIAAARQRRPEAEVQRCSPFCSLRIKLRRKSVLFSSSTTQGAGSGVWLYTSCAQDLLSWHYSLS